MVQSTGSMRVLLDTNILIGREDARAIPGQFADLIRILTQNAVPVLIHPLSLEEIRGDPDKLRREVVLSKAYAYPQIEDPPQTDSEFVENYGRARNAHDAVDQALLYCVQRNAVDFLITEDQDLLRAAGKVGLRDRTLTVASALEYFSAFFGRALPPVPVYIRKTQLHSLELQDPFFDSFRGDYPGFNLWFEKSARAGRICYSVRLPGGRIGAILILKEESEPLLGLPATRRLKISSMKVSNALAGYRVGELLLSIPLHYCNDNGIDQCFVTVFSKYESLIDLFSLFGFLDIGETALGERILLKHFGAGENPERFAPLTYLHRFYPRFRSDSGVRKFLVPIQPDYHSLLFPEDGPRYHQTTLDGVFVPSSSAGNAVRKAYLCNAKTTQVRSGDLALFYRSRDRHSITHLGVIEQVQYCENIQDLLRFAGNRTVLSQSKLSELVQRRVLALLFWNIGRMYPPRGLKELRELGLGWPQSITELADRDYVRLYPSERVEH
jgi:predicted nucleic acid-binding protein